MMLCSRGLYIYLKETENEGLERVHLAKGWVQWLSAIKMVTHRF